MRRTTEESLVKYVAEMYDREDEYENAPVEIIKDLEKKEDEASGKMASIYDEILGQKICTLCDKRKLFDKKNNEFYCPIHE